MELAIHDIKGKDTGRKAKLSKNIFAIEPNDHAIYLDVKQYLANNRKGLHKAKERAEIKGSTRKIKKQKGTGTARAGSIKNPLFRGGGRVFGPRPRSYDQKVNKKVKRLARKSALSYKAKSKAIMIIEDFDFSKPNTKGYLSILSALDLQAKKTLMVLNGGNKNIYLSSRNLKNSNVVVSSELNTYEITDATNVLILESAVDGLESNLK
ncbi:MAG: 50S ribosomal protein L4 [Flavobacteriaceae bacterium]|nr:50S ribosomal protein L4 [Flavobacteriaceae bacterium]|tara:strand:- start:487 stop:1113 length:627 start_codon:yes stop_codon:yes gene_type:complete